MSVVSGSTFDSPVLTLTYHGFSSSPITLKLALNQFKHQRIHIEKERVRENKNKAKWVTLIELGNSD